MTVGEPAGAAVRVLDDETVAKLADYERSDLSERHKISLRFADAVMSQPGQISDELWAAMRSEFTHDEIVEMTIDVLKWNMQKVTVALGVDAEVVEGQLVDLVFDERGNWVR